MSKHLRIKIYLDSILTKIIEGKIEYERQIWFIEQKSIKLVFIFLMIMIHISKDVEL